MRWLIGFMLFSSFSLYGQSRLPHFHSELLEAVEIDTLLKNSPSEYYIQKYEYQKSSGELVADNVILHYFFKGNSLDHIDFVKDKEVLKSNAYDQYGRITRQERFDPKEKVKKLEYAYNDEKRIATETVYRYAEQIHSRNVVQYNDHYQVTSKEEYRGVDRLSKFWVYKYNDHYDLVSDQYFDASSQSRNGRSNKYIPVDSTYFIHQYDGFERKTKTSKYHENQLASETIYSYFQDSTVQQETFYNFNGKTSEQHVRIAHDSLKMIVRGFFYNGDTSKVRSRFKEVFLYDDLVEYEKRTSSGTYVDRFKTYYEYDELGNWIQKITYSNGLVIRKEERTIIY
ncbi:hypothetical protein [Roseivirga misakiensis]|uniref:Sugar-binding protein n=1 Tax=Roseivirga misakiensis TaxID=1563681 RepID=A0A1E5SYW4_9BACT|nr:hypothetical protein [Roseivirga misakiensis]OEK04328.1 hypothetical protein BFP71_12660 [Roseivirga misakiensis]